jgi:cell division protein FtsB
LAWILFFAQYNLFTVFGKKKELNEMESKITFLEKEIERLEKKREELKTNPKEIERQSRERYYMKKDNEDVFVYDTVQAQ